MFLWPRYEKEKEFNDTLRTGARRFKKKQQQNKVR